MSQVEKGRIVKRLALKQHCGISAQWILRPRVSLPVHANAPSFIEHLALCLRSSRSGWTRCLSSNYTLPVTFLQSEFSFSQTKNKQWNIKCLVYKQYVIIASLFRILSSIFWLNYINLGLGNLHKIGKYSIISVKYVTTMYCLLNTSSTVR